MNTKRCIQNLIMEVEKLSRVVESIISDGASHQLNVNDAILWNRQLSGWLLRLKQFESSSNDPMFDLKAFGWGHHFANLANFYSGGFSWSIHESEYDSQFQKVFDVADVLASAMDIRILPRSAAPPI